MRSPTKSKLFRRMVLSYFSILAIPIIIFCVFFYNQIRHENRELAQKSYEENISNITGVSDRAFLGIHDLGNRLLTANWIKRARSSSDIITRYFDSTRANDICHELLVHTASLDAADSLTVLLPSKMQAVSSAGWGSMEDILPISGFDDAAGRQTLLQLVKKTGRFQLLHAGKSGIIPSSDDLVVIQSLDVLDDSRAFLLVRIEKNTLDAYFQKFRFSELSSLSLIDAEGEELYHLGSAADEDGYTSSSPSALFSWSYQITLRKFLPSGQLEQFSTVILALLLTLSVGLLAAYLLAMVSYRPIRNLVRRIGGDRREPEFQVIYRTLNRLTAEKQELNAMLEQHRSAARNNLLFSLLHGCFANEKIQSQMEDCQIPYQDSQFFTVLLFHCPETLNDQRFTLFLNIKAALIAEKAPFDLLETLDEDLVAILHFENPDQTNTAVRLAEKLPLLIQEELGISLTVSSGSEERGIIGISKSYQAAREHNDRLRFPTDHAASSCRVSAVRCYYPTDWELQFVNNLKLGNTEPALKILSELRRENDERNLPPVQQMKLTSMIFDTILRLMDELDMDAAEPAAFLEENFGQSNSEQQWEYLSKLSRLICGRTSYTSETRSSAAGEQILHYVDTHFEDPALSLQVLADQMGLSVSAISRIFKATVKINFCDYLCRIRMERAKELLQSSDDPISEISRQVGYENELSFKRAFVRYEGIRPREYRLNMQEHS